MLSGRVSIEQASTWYRGALCLTAIVSIALALYKLQHGVHLSAYVHRLVSWEDGFIRRALVGTVYRLFADGRITPFTVWLEGLVTVCIVAILFFDLLRRSISANHLDRLAIMAFLLGSPLLLKNFLHNMAFLDILGFGVAIVSIRLPIRIFSVIVLTAICFVLLLCHHIHATLTIPLMFAIFALRAAETPAVRSLMLLLGAGLVMLAVAFFIILVFGVPSVSHAVFLERMQSHAAVAIEAHGANMWYSNIGSEISTTIEVLPRQIPRLPVYLFVLLAHAPLIVLGLRGLARQAADDRTGHRRFVAAVAVVTAAYCLTMVIAFDTARFIADYSFCIVLLTLVRLNARGPFVPAQLWDPTLRWVIACAIVVSMIPRLGTGIPF